MRSTKKKKIITAFLITLIVNLMFSPSLMIAQTTDLKVKVRPDPANPKRKIIELPRLQRPAQVIRLKQNVLDSPQFRRRAIPFQKFEMVGTTGKPLDPNAVIKLPDGRSLTTRQFYDEANTVEENLNKSGYSLRSPDTFDNIRLTIDPRTFSNMQIPAGAKRISQSEFSTLKNNITANNGKISSTGPVGKIDSGSVKNSLPGNVGDFFAYVAGSGPIGRSNSNEITAVWDPDSCDCGASGSFLVKIPKGSEQKYGKLVWQVSQTPFQPELNPLQNPNIVKAGIIKANWNYKDSSQIYKQGKDGFSYMQFDIDFKSFTSKQNAKYYVRAVLTDQNNSSPAATPGIPVNLTIGTSTIIDVPTTEYGDVYKQPNTDVPGGDAPFGFYFHKNALSSRKYKNSSKTIGYKISGGAELGVRYFNFENLIDGSSPKYKEQALLGGKFEAVAGLGTGTGGSNETQGARLILTIGGVETPIDLTPQQTVPAGEYDLNYDKSEVIDQQLIYIIIPLGPLNIVVKANLTGNYGFTLGGRINFMNNSAYGYLKLYVNTKFQASGGLELPLSIAYVNMTGTSDPLFNTEITSTFGSENSPRVNQFGHYDALKIDVRLNAGFYHPCPPIKQVKKIWGYIKGDTNSPLCKTEWNYNIFQSNGYSDSWDING